MAGVVQTDKCASAQPQQEQIPPTPATAKTALAGDPGRELEKALAHNGPVGITELKRFGQD
jgi:hypothetical protein